ncbi:ATP-dependent Clp protease proteolytic subunit [Geobacter sp.]|uniref:ATP-dependent Clp protease proteolytic subunit n=1 Tax=Geobacter sp. TaxID=46610 RepID=UPI0027B9B5AF|nr:ATP-dependent Clp protease proteolytic subunit [Geobacter sp.]
MAKDGNKQQKENGLSDYGIIYLSGAIDSGTAEGVCKEIIEYNIRGEVNQIQMIINSPGGSCPAGFSIIDIMEWSRIPIYTTGIGMIASMGLLVFMTGERGRRVITPRTSILSHRFSAFNFGNHSQLIASRKEEDLEHERILQHYLSYSNISSREELENYLLRDVDTWLAPEEAIQYGLADVIEPLRTRSH